MNWKKTIVLSLVLATTWAQASHFKENVWQVGIIEGRLVVEGSGEPIPFASIGVPGKNLGTISRPDGTYKINLTDASSTDSLVFSSVGYERRSYLVGDLKSSRLEVKMTERVIQLADVTVTRKREKPKVQKLGRPKPSKTTRGQSGIEDFGFGGENAIRINKLDKAYHLQDINFHLRFNTVDSILFRINIYTVRDDLPHEPFLGEELFVTCKKGQKWIRKELSESKIVVDRDLIISYEVIRIWYRDTGSNNVFFTYGSGYPEGGAYLRRSSLDRWMSDESGTFPIALYVTGHIY